MTISVLFGLSQLASGTQGGRCLLDPFTDEKQHDKPKVNILQFSLSHIPSCNVLNPSKCLYFKSALNTV